MNNASDGQPLSVGTQQDAYLRIKAGMVTQLLDLVGELGLAAAEVIHHPRLEELELEGFESAVHRLENLIRDLQDLASSLRLVPVGTVFKRMQRLVRDLSRQTGKPLDLVLEGVDTQIDKNLVDQFHDPLMHLIRNAVDHGIESVEERSAVSADALSGFLESVGEMVATRATLHRVTQRLTEVDLADTMARLMKQSDGDWQRVGKELQASLQSWTEDLSTLSHAETEMGAALDQFQETALALRARPAAEILDPLQRLVQDVARHLGKMVELDVTGADIGLDYGALDILADPVRRLVWFAVAHGIEKPVQRREVGKPMTGRVSAAVRKAADHVQVVIEDDGGGIDLDAVLKRARELGWMNGDSVPAGKLSEWVFRDRFGIVGGSYDVEGIDLAAINAELRAQRGWLEVSSEPGRGTRFALDVPLDMVVIDGMVMRVGGVHYVVPIEAVRRIVKPEATQIVHSSADGGRDLLRLEEELVPVRALRQGPGQALTGNAHEPVLSVSRRGGAVLEGLLLVVEAGEQGIALAVDELIGQQQVLIQPLQGHLAEVQGISGCALLGEGDVGVVLDLNRMNV